MRQIVKNERAYYKDLLSYSREHLMMYPYHLSDVVVQGLRVTPFQYYISVLTEIMTAEKSYDSLPNFTAADCKGGWMLRGLKGGGGCCKVQNKGIVEEGEDELLQCV